MKIRSNPSLAQTEDRRQAAATITEPLLSSEQQSYLLILYVYKVNRIHIYSINLDTYTLDFRFHGLLQKLSGFASMGPGYVNLSLWHPRFVRINY